MTSLTISDLIPHLKAAVGDDDDIELNVAMANAPLDDLGIDSLAVIDATNRIERELSIALPDGSTDDAATMQELCDAINLQLSAAV